MIKRTFIVAMCVLPAALFAQEYTIKGKLSRVEAPAKVYLGYRSGKKYVRDSAEVKNGTFELKGKVTEPVAASLLLQPRDSRTVYLENTTITVTGTDKMSTAKVEGGENNRYYTLLQQQLAPVDKQAKELSAETDKKKREENSEALEAARKKVYAAFISANPNTIVSLDLLDSYGGIFPEASDLEPLYNKLSTAVKQTTKGKNYAETIAKLKRTEIGSIAPEFTQNDTDGKPVKLADYRGKFVLVDFWASWCKPCRAENPAVVKAYNDFKDKNFTVLGISLDIESGRAAWLKAIKDDNLTWTQLIDLMDEKAADIYNVKAIPQNFLIDPQGKIIAKNLRGDQLAGKLSEVLN